MDYYKKYIKYKTKYLSITGKLNEYNFDKPNKTVSKKYAIVMFCILKDHYVLGACIAAYLHKLFIKKTNKDIDLVIMCDDYIYKKYKSILSNYFDRVIQIKLRHFELSEKYEFAKHKYSSWIGYSMNKWQCLNLTEYEKILFLDIDILPSSIKLYDLFSFNTPAIHIHHLSNHLCFNSRLVPKPTEKKLSYDEYIKNLYQYGSLDGGILLLKPNSDMYNKYVKMTDELFKDGAYGHNITAIDETSLFYFFLANDIPIYDICVDYAVIPWDDSKYVQYAKSYNFLSFVKPWTKPKIISWKEEMIWRYIYDKMPKKDKLEKLFEKVITDSIDIYKSYDERQKSRYYNLEYVKKYREEFEQISRLDKKFKKIMELDKKIEISGFGILKTDEIVSILDNKKIDN